ncbi:MAG: N-acetylmuramoyl-L-alanine amidase, partial [Minisyncoccia bacterium]
GYTKQFSNYFSENKLDIKDFKEKAKLEMKNKISDGSFIEKENVLHNPVTENTSIVLYGINKWADENKIDAVIHIHFNDYPRKTKWTVGKYKGFAIYMPDKQFLNNKKSQKIASNIYLQLSKKYTPSNYKKELGGLVPEQKLIAIGANHTLQANVGAVLVEYGYIYEKRFKTLNSRKQEYKKMAILTANGIINSFYPNTQTSR